MVCPEVPSTHLPLEVRVNEESMTIGIGCICDRGETVVFASDLRATYGPKYGWAA